jgi:two-component system, response regulator PdtaR
MTELCILVVEDDAIIATLLAQMLVGMGHNVCATEATEADAVASAARHQPDLMIVDVRLRNGSGLSAVRRIVENGQVPHIFISADRLQEVTPGAVLLRKPFREAELVEAMGDALGRGPSALNRST